MISNQITTPRIAIGYDSHLIVKGMSKLEQKKIQAMAYNTEKLRNLTVHNFKLSDSLSFIQGSLSDLVNNLASSNGTFNVLDQMKIARSDNQKQLLLRKGTLGLLD